MGSNRDTLIYVTSQQKEELLFMRGMVVNAVSDFKTTIDLPSTIGGGINNTASLTFGTVGGGGVNTASGNYSTVPGGQNNEAAGDYSFAAGRRAKANHNGTYVWADYTDYQDYH